MTLLRRSLTAKQIETLGFIREFVARNHYAPTFEEMRVGLGLGSKNSVEYRLVSLELAGAICRKRRAARAIRVME